MYGVTRELEIAYTAILMTCNTFYYSDQLEVSIPSNYWYDFITECSSDVKVIT